MIAPRLFKTLRLNLLVVIGILLGSVIVGLYHLNQNGLSSQWRGRIAQELETLGITADFQALRLDFTKGLTAQGVRIYSDGSRENTVATLDHLILDLDKTKFLRGILRVNNVSLKQATIALPLAPEDPQSEQLSIHDLSGQIYITNKNSLDATNIVGKLAGIQLDIDAHVFSTYKAGKANQLNSASQQTRIHQISSLLEQLKQWQWPAENPPLLTAHISGNIHKKQSLIINFSLDATELEHTHSTAETSAPKPQKLEKLTIKGSYKNQLVTLENLSITESTGSLTARGSYHPTLRQGNFRLSSQVAIQPLAKRFLNINTAETIDFTTPPKIEGNGRIEINENNQVHLQLTGKLTTDELTILGSPLRALTTEFTTEFTDQDTKLFLTNLKALSPRGHEDGQGQITGRLLLDDELIRYELESTLPASSYTPLLHHHTLAKILSDTSYSQASSIYILSEGQISRDTPNQWKAEGYINLQNISYNNSPLKALSANYQTSNNSSSQTSTLSNIQADFDYLDYQLYHTYDGPSSGQIQVQSITLDTTEGASRASIDNMHGRAWPAPIVRLFAPTAADHIESYRFRRPPSLTASGTIITPASEENTPSEATRLAINLTSQDTTDYLCLGRELPLENLQTKVLIDAKSITLNELSFQLYQGFFQGRLTTSIPYTSDSHYRGNFSWSDLSLQQIGRRYSLPRSSNGTLNGTTEFHGQWSQIDTLNASGKVQLNNANILTLPILSSITPLLAESLGQDQLTAHHTGISTSSYTIKNGILHTPKLSSSTADLSFSAAGSLNLANRSIDITAKTQPTRQSGSHEGQDSESTINSALPFQAKGSLSQPQWQQVLPPQPPAEDSDQ